MRKCLGTSLFRALVLYLVVRALCAPVALRTQAMGAALGKGFVLRVCTWPVIKEHLAAAELTRDLDDADRVALDLPLLPWPETLHTPAEPSRFDPSRPVRDAARDRSLARLRC